MKLTKQLLSFWALMQQRRRRKRTPNAHRVIVTPSAALFGDVLANDSKDLVVKLYNKTTHALTITAINITSANAVWGTDVSLPLTINAAASNTVTLQFLPTSAGAQSASFDLVTNAGTFTVGATGNGV